MNSLQFIHTINLHDSILDNMVYDYQHKTVIMTIDFAFWMQSNYKKSEPETGMIQLTFSNVADFQAPKEIDYGNTSFLGCTLKDDSLIFILLNDFTDDTFEIKILAGAVDFQKLSSENQ